MKWDGTDYIYTRVDGTEYRMKDPFPSLTKKYWNLNTPWNLEQKITWDEIAPSLQELILVCRYIEWEDLGPNLQGILTGYQNGIQDNTNTINNEIDDRIEADEYLQEQITNLLEQVSAITNRITNVESTVLSIQNYINSEIKPELINLSNRIDVLDTYIENIWGSELYRNNHSQYNIYQLWQKINELLDRITILESEETPDWSGDISDLIRRVTKLENDVEILNTNVTQIWSKIATIETDVDKIKVDLYGDDPIISSGRVDWTVVYKDRRGVYNTDITYNLHGAWIKLKDIGDTSDNPTTIILQMMWNTGNSIEDNGWWWPLEGLYMKLPVPFPNKAVMIQATDIAPLQGNGCQAMGACFGNFKDNPEGPNKWPIRDVDTEYGGSDNYWFGIKRKNAEIEKENTITWGAFAIGY